jgi:hypothetical protein
MKFYNILNIILLTLFVNVIICGQSVNPSISFETSEHDFGQIKENNGPVSYRFVFTNIGGKPLIINDVHASCGCTSPLWTSEPVLPGRKGFIDVTFNPYGRGGETFNKTVTIKSNAEEGTVVIKIKGYVIPSEKTTDELYPYLMQNLRFKANMIDFGQLLNTSTKSQNIEFINISDEKIKISFKDLKPYFSATVNPKVIGPKQKGEIILTYNAALRNDWDFLIDTLKIVQNKIFNNTNIIVVTATINEDFSFIKHDSIFPSIRIDNRIFDFGELKINSSIEHEFIIKNEGKSNLIIHKTKSSCGCTIIKFSNNVIKPGEESNMKVIFKSDNKTGYSQKSITIISNDPLKPKIVLTVKGFITK